MKYTFAPNCAGFLRPKGHRGKYIFKNLSLANEIYLSAQTVQIFSDEKVTVEITFSNDLSLANEIYISALAWSTFPDQRSTAEITFSRICL